MRLSMGSMARAWLGAVGAAAALGGLPGCGGGGGGTTNTPPPSTETIITRTDASAPMGFSFDSPVTVRSGTVVRWSNTSSAPHSIVWDTWSPSASPAPGGGIATFAAGTMSDPWTAPTVSAATTYNYHCGIHGPTMAGVINVTP